METYTMADLGRSPKKACSEKEPVLITNNGRPQNLVFNIGNIPIDMAVDIAREVQGRIFFKALQQQARENGLSDMTMEEIDAEIQAARKGL